MRYTQKQYAATLFEVLKSKPEAKKTAYIRRFLQMLAKRGERKNLGLILKEIEKLYLKDSGKKKVVLETADSVKTELKQEISKILGKNVFWEEKENPRLIAGAKILINDELLIDASAERQVRKLFSATT